MLGIAEHYAASLKYSSVLGPGFDFNAIADEDGRLKSAHYQHTKRDSPSVDSPIDLPIWSVDVGEFTEHFGPMRGGRQWSLFDKILPAYEEYKFPWDGESYGAGFSWGLFMYSAKSWD